MQTEVFWKAAVLTIVILIIGIIIGIWIDSGRAEEIKTDLTENDLIFNDVRLQTLYHENFLPNNKELCDIAFESNLEYNNKIYQQGLRLEQYEQQNKFSESLYLERKRYALQQMQFWINAVKIKEVCDAEYTTILHLFLADTGNNSDVEIPQKLQSATMLDLKEKCGTNLMLSPVPIDLNLTSIKMIAKTYGINQTPALVINKDIVIEGFANLTELEQYVNC